MYRDRDNKNNGDTALHGYAHLSDTVTYILEKDKAVVHNGDSTLLYQWNYLPLPNRFQPLLWANILQERPHVLDYAVSCYIEMKQLLPNKHLLSVNRGSFFYNTKYDYECDMEGRVVQVRVWGTFENTIDQLINITYN